MEIMEYYFNDLTINNLFFYTCKVFRTHLGYQPSEDTTVVKQ